MDSIKQMLIPIEEAEKIAYEKGKEERLASTYKSSKVYLMGYNEAKQEIIKRIKKWASRFPIDVDIDSLNNFLNSIK